MAKVYLAYSSYDKDFVKNLAESIHYSSNNDVWYDDWEIKVGDSIISKISEGINTSDYLIAVLSKNSVKSKWVKEELEIAMVLTIEKGAFILPIKIEDCEMPAFLINRRYANFADDWEKAYKELMSVINQEEEISEKDKTIYYILSQMLNNILKEQDYDSAPQEKRDEILKKIAKDFEGFSHKWGMPQKIYEIYIKECIHTKKILSQSEFIEKTPEMIEENPNLQDEITPYLVDIFLKSFDNSSDDEV